VPLCNPSQYEERRLRPRFAKNFEQMIGIAFDPARQPLPITPIDCRCKCFDLKIIFDIDRHRVRGIGARLGPLDFFAERSGRASISPWPLCGPAQPCAHCRHGRSL
jgi:hypothetical protein